MGFEGGGEVGLVGVAYAVGYLRHIDGTLAQQSGGLFHAEVAQELAGRDASDVLHLAVQLCTTDAHVGSQRVDVEVGVLDIGIHRPHDALHQYVVVALHLNILGALFLFHGTAELATQAAHAVDEIVNLYVQFLHVEGFGDVGVGSRLQAFQLEKQTAALWLTRVVTPRRFKNEKALAAYCGCDPSLKVSAGKVTSTVKRGGRKDIHSALCQAASNLMRLHSEPFGRFGYNIAMQTGVWQKGVSALARKLAVAMYFMSLHREMFSYEKYKLVSDPDVINMSIEELAAINPAFRRYIRYLINSGITDTKILAHQYAICGLPSIKGLGKNFFALVKDFINEQDTYKKSYERMQSNAENRFENQSPGNE